VGDDGQQAETARRSLAAMKGVRAYLVPLVRRHLHLYAPSGGPDRPAGGSDRPAGGPDRPAGDPDRPAGDPDWPAGGPPGLGPPHETSVRPIRTPDAGLGGPVTAQAGAFGAAQPAVPGYVRPTMSPFSSMSIRSAAEFEASPGMVRMSPQIG